MSRWLLIVLSVTLCGSLFSGCADGRNKNNLGPFILDVESVIDIEANGASAIVTLDSRLFGVLYLCEITDENPEGETISVNVLLASGTVDFGSLPDGTYYFLLEGYDEFTQEFEGSVRTGEFTFNSGTTCPDSDGDGLCDDDDPCPTDPSNQCDKPGRDKPYIICNFNEDGGVVVELHDFSSPKILRRISQFADDYDVVVMPDEDVFFDVPLEPGEYAFVLLELDCDDDPETAANECELARCSLVIPDPPGTDDPPSPPPVEDECQELIDSLDPELKYVVCHIQPNGRIQQVIVDWHALYAHLCIRGGTLGAAVDH